MKYLELLVACIVLFELVPEMASFYTKLDFLVEQGARECLYQQLVKGLGVIFRYNIVKGTDKVVRFTVSSPSNQPVTIIEMHRVGTQDLIGNFTTGETGEYMVCFDNTYFHAKVVSLFLFARQFEDPLFPVTSEREKISATRRDELGELNNRVENFTKTFKLVEDNLEKAQRYQEHFQTNDLIDTGLMENNLQRVQFWSILNIIVMVGVSLMQVYLIRSLFDERSQLGMLLRGGGGAQNRRRNFN